MSLQQTPEQKVSFAAAHGAIDRATSSLHQEDIQFLSDHLAAVKLKAEEKAFSLNAEIRKLRKALAERESENRAIKQRMAIVSPEFSKRDSNIELYNDREHEEAVGGYSDSDADSQTALADPVAIAWEHGNRDFGDGNIVDGVRHYTTAARMLAANHAAAAARVAELEAELEEVLAEQSILMERDRDAQTVIEELKLQVDQLRASQDSADKGSTDFEALHAEALDRLEVTLAARDEEIAIMKIELERSNGLHDEVERLQRLQTEKEFSLQKLMLSNADLQRELDQVKGVEQPTDEADTTARIELEELQVQHVETQSRNEELAKQVADLTQQLQESVASNSYKQLEQLLGQARLAEQRSSERVSELESALANMVSQESYAELQEKYNELYQGAEQGISANQNDDLLSRIAELEEQLASMVSEDEYNEIFEKCEKLERAAEKHKEDFLYLQKAEAEITSLRLSSNQAEDAYNELALKCSAAEEELVKKKDQLVKLMNKLKKVKQDRFEEAQRFESENQELVRQIEELKQSTGSYSTDALPSSEFVNEQNSQQQAAEEMSQRLISELREKLQESRSLNMKYETEEIMLNSKSSDLEQLLEDAKSTIAKLQEKEKAAELAVADLTSKMEFLDAEKKELQTKLQVALDAQTEAVQNSPSTNHNTHVNPTSGTVNVGATAALFEQGMSSNEDSEWGALVADRTSSPNDANSWFGEPVQSPNQTGTLSPVRSPPTGLFSPESVEELKPAQENEPEQIQDDKHAELEAMKEEVELLVTQLDEAEERFDSLHRDHQDALVRLQEAEALVSSVEFLQQELSALRVENEQYKEEAHMQSMSQVPAVTSQEDETVSANGFFGGDDNEWGNTSSLATDTPQQLLSDNVADLGRMQELQDQIQMLQATNQKLQDEAAALRSRDSAHEYSKGPTDEDVNALEHALQRIEELENELMSAKLAVQSEEDKSAAALFDDAQESNDLSKALARADTLQQELDGLRETVSHLEAELENHQMVAASNAQESALQLSTLQSELEQLRMGGGPENANNMGEQPSHLVDSNYLASLEAEVSALRASESELRASLEVQSAVQVQQSAKDVFNVDEPNNKDSAQTAAALFGEDDGNWGSPAPTKTPVTTEPELRAQLDAAEASVALLQEQLSDAENLNAENQKLISKLSAEKETSSLTISRLEDTFARSQREKEESVQELQGEAETTEVAIEELEKIHQDKVHEKETELAAMREKLQSLNDQLEAAKKADTVRCSEIEQLNLDLEQASELRLELEDKVELLQGEVDSLKADVFQLADESETAQKLVESKDALLERSNKDLLVANEKADQLQGELQLLQEQSNTNIDTLEKKVAQLEAEAHQLVTAREELEGVKSHIEMLEKEKTEVLAQVESLSDTKNSLEEQLSTSNTSLNESREAYKKTHSELETVIEALRSYEVDKAQLEKEVAALKVSLTEANDELESLKSTYNASEEERAVLVQSVENLKAQVIETESTLEELRAQHETLNREAFDREVEKGQLEAKLQDTETELEEARQSLQQDIERLKQELQDLSNKDAETIEHLRSSLQAAEASTVALASEVDLIKESKNTEVNALMSEKSDLESRIADLEQAKKEGDAYKEELYSTIAELESEGRDNREMIDELKAKVLESEELSAMKEELRVRDAVLATLSQRITKLAGQNHELKQERDRAREDAAAMYSPKVALELDGSDLRRRQRSPLVSRKGGIAHVLERQQSSKSEKDSDMDKDAETDMELRTNNTVEPLAKEDWHSSAKKLSEQLTEFVAEEPVRIDYASAIEALSVDVETCSKLAAQALAKRDQAEEHSQHLAASLAETRGQLEQVLLEKDLAETSLKQFEARAQQAEANLQQSMCETVVQHEEEEKDCSDEDNAPSGEEEVAKLASKVKELEEQKASQLQQIELLTSQVGQVEDLKLELENARAKLEMLQSSNADQTTSTAAATTMSEIVTTAAQSEGDTTVLDTVQAEAQECLNLAAQLLKDNAQVSALSKKLEDAQREREEAESRLHRVEEQLAMRKSIFGKKATLAAAIPRSPGDYVPKPLHIPGSGSALSPSRSMRSSTPTQLGQLLNDSMDVAAPGSPLAAPWGDVAWNEGDHEDLSEPSSGDSDEQKDRYASNIPPLLLSPSTGGSGEYTSESSFAQQQSSVGLDTDESGASPGFRADVAPHAGEGPNSATSAPSAPAGTQAASPDNNSTTTSPKTSSSPQSKISRWLGIGKQSGLMESSLNDDNSDFEDDDLEGEDSPNTDASTSQKTTQRRASDMSDPFKAAAEIRSRTRTFSNMSRRSSATTKTPYVPYSLDQQPTGIISNESGIAAAQMSGQDEQQPAWTEPPRPDGLTTPQFGPSGANGVAPLGESTPFAFGTNELPSGGAHGAGVPMFADNTGLSDQFNEAPVGTPTELSLPQADPLELQETINQLKSKVRDLEAQLEMERGQRMWREGQYCTTEQELERCLEENEALAESLRSAEQRLKNAQDELVEWSSECERLRATTSDAALRADSQSSEAKRLASLLSSQQTEVQLAKEAADKLSQELEAAVSASEGRKQELALLAERLQERDQDLKHLVNNLSLSTYAGSANAPSSMLEGERTSVAVTYRQPSALSTAAEWSYNIVLPHTLLLLTTFLLSVGTPPEMIADLLQIGGLMPS